MITGNLKQDSAAVAKQLEAILSPQDYKLILNTYSKICKNQHIQAETEQRDPGLSFSPKPARIISILINDAQIRQVERFQNALEGLLKQIA